MTSAVLFINAGICTFTASADSSAVFTSNEEYSLYIDHLPTKTVYQIDEEFDISGTKIYGSYTDGELVGDIFPTDLARYLENGMMSLDTSEFDNTKAGTYTIYIHYGTATDSFEVTVTDEAVVEENTTLKEFFVYVGTYGDGLPQFRYLHQKSDGSYTADKVIWENAPTDIAYGDIFVADGEINLTKVYPAADNPVYAHAYHYTIDEDAVLNSFGKCTDIMEKKNLTITSTTYDGSSHWSIRYKDDNDKEYYYGLSVLASNLEVDPLDCEVGDVYTFALYNDYMVIPLSEHNIEENAVMTVEITEIDGDTLFVRQSGNSGDLMTLSVKYLDSNIQPTVGMKLEVTYSGGILETYPAQFGNIKKVSAISDYTSVAGDANGDGDFTIADMVTVQRAIMGRKTAILSDCKAADLYEDGKIDVYDFILMRKNIIEKSK